MTGRIELPPSLTPGPGDYEHEAKKTAAQAQDEKVREAKRMSSWQPRFLDAMCRKKTQEVISYGHKIILKYVSEILRQLVRFGVHFYRISIL